MLGDTDPFASLPTAAAPAPASAAAVAILPNPLRSSSAAATATAAPPASLQQRGWWYGGRGRLGKPGEYVRSLLLSRNPSSHEFLRETGSGWYSFRRHRAFWLARGY